MKDCQMERQRSVALVFNEKGQILIIKRLKEGRKYATLPGGGVEDEVLEDACIREVLEETSIKIDSIKYLLTEKNYFNNAIEHYFLCFAEGIPSIQKGSPEDLRNSSNNSYQPLWINIDEIENINLVPEIAKELLLKWSKKNQSKTRKDDMGGIC